MSKATARPPALSTHEGRGRIEGSGRERGGEDDEAGDADAQRRDGEERAPALVLLPRQPRAGGRDRERRERDRDADRELDQRRAVPAAAPAVGARDVEHEELRRVERGEEGEPVE